MRIKTRLLWTLLGMSLLVALLGALAVERQQAAAMAGVNKEAEDVARVMSFLLMSDVNKLSGPALQEIVFRLHRAQGRDIVVMDEHQLILADAVPAEIGTIFANDRADEVGETIKDRRVRTFVEVSPAYPNGIKQIVVPVEDESRHVTGAVVLEYTQVYNEIMQLTQTTIREVVLAGIGSVVLALLLALYMGKSIAGPLGQLTKVAAGFASGRTDAPMPPPREDEIGELATAFSNMMAKRQLAENDLARLRDGLEVCVAERTHDLAMANAALHVGLATSTRNAAVLRASEEKFHQLADNITDVFWITSPDFGTIQFVSAGYEVIWGRSKESLYANPHQWVESILPEDRSRAFGIFGGLMENVSEVNVEYQIARPDGTVRWIHDRGFQVRDAAGKLVRLTGIASDITEARRTRVDLEQTRAQFAGLVNSVDGIVWEADATTFRFTFVSARAEHILGFPAEGWLSSADFWARQIHPADRQEAVDYCVNCTGRKEDHTFEYRMLAADGRVVWLRDIVTYVEEPGKPALLRGLMLDITASKQAEAERKSAEQATGLLLQRLNDAQRVGRIGDWAWDIASQAITWSPQVFEIFGRNQHLGPPRDFEELRTLHDAASWPRLQENITRAVESGVPQTYELVVLRPDGERIEVQAMAVPRRDESGWVVGLYGTVQDITERQRASALLLESQQRLALATESAGIGIWDWDVVTNQLVWDAQMYALYGLREGEFSGAYDAWQRGLHPEDRERAEAEITAARHGAAGFHIEFRVVWPNGEVRHIEAHALMQRAGDTHMVGVNWDITERVKAERALTASEERTRLIVATAHDAFIGMDSTGSICDWNPQAEAIFGWSREEAVGRFMHLLIIPPKFRAMHVKGLQHFLETGVGPVLNKLIELPALHRNGHEMPIELMISPIRVGDSYIFSASARDITERKRAEAELNQAKEAAEAANRAKGEFLANMSHEIRTPMNGIIGMTELVLETALDRDQREYLGMAKSSALSLLTLINHILDFSKIEAGKLELEAISFSLRHCIGTMLKPLGLRAEAKGLELAADIPAATPDHLIGDPMRLRQILVNLTDNAIKFTERGDVTLHVAVESVTGDEHCLHFSVCDTGIGIPAAKQALIFEAFAQADGTTTRTHGGTGLGLAIASRLVRQMGGRIWVESTVGDGTSFHFTIGLPVRHTPAPDMRHLDPSALAGLHVLLVDDNAVNRRILRDMLIHWRMQPTVVASGATAIVEMLQAARAGTPFPLVILDGMMPEMDGLMVAEQMREHRELSGATVMMLSSAMAAGSAARCAELGVSSYLTKPVTQAELIDAILVALGKAARVRPAADEARRAPTERALRILLAEDNVINRALATGILEKRGHSLVHAANGREAVEAAAHQDFDLIFMDVQMPEMDGLEATRRIREAELATGRRTPIAAMTAHAMAGDRERCLASGMDEYIAKPLHKEELFALVTRVSAEWMPPQREVPSAARTDSQLSRVLPAPVRAAGPRAPSIYSRARLLDQLDGDEGLLRRMIALFHENTPQLLDQIRDSIARRSAGDLSRSVHSLLSSLGAFGATNAHQLSRRLEGLGEHGDFTAASSTFADLKGETARVSAALAEVTLDGVPEFSRA